MLCYKVGVSDEEGLACKSVVMVLRVGVARYVTRRRVVG